MRDKQRNHGPNDHHHHHHQDTRKGIAKMKPQPLDQYHQSSFVPLEHSNADRTSLADGRSSHPKPITDEFGYYGNNGPISTNHDVASKTLDNGGNTLTGLSKQEGVKEGYVESVGYVSGPPNPLDSIWIRVLTFITFEWVTPLVLKGFKKPLEMNQLWELSQSHDTPTVFKRFEHFWGKYKGSIPGDQGVRSSSKLKTKKGRPLIKTIFACIWWKFLLAGIFKLIMDICTLSSPFIISQILIYVNPETPPDVLERVYEGYIWVIVLFGVQVLSLIVQGQHFYLTSVIAMDTRTALLAKVFEKAIRLSTKERQQKSTGEIVNLMSIDAQKVGEAFLFLHFSWSAVLIIFFSIVALSVLIGWIVVVTIVVMFSLLPIQAISFVLYSKWRTQVLKFSDQRIKSINEILNGMKIIKFFGWEQSYKDKITSIRHQEVKRLFRVTILRAVIGAIMMGGPVIVSVSTFIVFYFVYGPESLVPEIVFPAIAYFNIMRFPLTMFPFVIGFVVEALVSIGRLQQFLLKEEIVPIEKVSRNEDNIALWIKGASFRWDNAPTATHGKSKKKSKPRPMPVQIYDMPRVNIMITKGSFVMIVGSVASGKSSLVQAMIGEMPRLDGEIYINGSIAYVPQQPWIQNTTLRRNITFGKPFDKERYEKVVNVCNLIPDFKVLPAQDMSEIGEKGINLSGGQRQRISLARAVYSMSDIFIMDDPLSALDAHVGKFIFEECFLNFMKGKTRILVTHQLQYLNYASIVIVMEHGEIKEKGTYQHLLSQQDSYLSRLIREYSIAEHKKSDDEIVSVKKGAEEQEKKEGENIEENLGKLISSEERTLGAVSYKVVTGYMKKMGGPVVILFIAALFIVSQAALVSSDAWIAVWTSGGYAYLDEQIPGRLIIYASLGVIGPTLVFFRDLVFLFAALYAAYRLHIGLLDRVLKAPMYFFDTTPLGRILSRFSKDQENVDTILIVVLNQLLTSIMQVVAIIVIISYTVFWFLIPLVPMMLIYLIVQQLFRRTSREIKRLDAISRSPLYSHFGETLNGLSTIRAYDRQESFININRKYVGYNQRAYYAILATQRWITFRLDVIGSVLILFAGLLILATRESIPAGTAGFALVYSLQTTAFLSFAVRQSTDAEAQMSSVERIMYYSSQVPVEKDVISTSLPVQITNTWPERGEIRFIDFEMKYRPELDPVLHNVTLHIKAGEKIGIVGRTGAGKSTLMLALFRISEASRGSVLIDGIDISRIALHELRRRLSIIPQEPLLFTGTIRSNLDPFNEYGDEYLWDVLERAHLKETVENLTLKLDTVVVEGGENFSLGQRQLLCLARALTRKTTILVMDEATSSVDLETDSIIQNTVRDAFPNCTRLTIAHRLNTIIDSDRIIVMDKGIVAEFDTPRKLLETPSSIFSSLVSETGVESANYLKSIVLGKS